MGGEIFQNGPRKIDLQKLGKIELCLSSDNNGGSNPLLQNGWCLWGLAVTQGDASLSFLSQNFIDVISRIQIENLLLQCCPTLIFVEHDETFLNTVTTKRIDFAKSAC